MKTIRTTGRATSMLTSWGWPSRRVVLLFAVVALAMVTSAWLVFGLLLQADTPTTASFRAEAATKTGVTTITDATATDGSAIQFGAVPAEDTPQPFSADPLPTVQINGIVWAQVLVGNTVYATGRFTQARPAGVAVGGAGSVNRTNLVAYDITTGVMTSFNHSLTGTSGTIEGRAIAASPDGKRLYVGGTFSAVDGQARSNIVGFDLTNNTLLGGFTSGTDKTVRALAATNTQVYVGGQFAVAGGQTRNRLAAYTSTGSLVSNWAPSISNVTGTHGGAYVAAMTIAQNKLIFGGYFNRLNGNQYLSSAAVTLDTGVPLAWASQNSGYPIRTQLKAGATSGQGVAITSMTTDGSQVYITSFSYAGVNVDGAAEGRISINPANGNINWVNDCHGDTYGAVPIGGVLYSVGHPHDCQPAGAYPETNPNRKALAETINPAGTNLPTTDPGHGYANFAGIARTSQLAWYPTLNTGTVSGSSQAAWSIVGNSNYLSLGGEFTTAENTPQQGLVRYTIASKAPNKRGPAGYGAAVVAISGAANTEGKITVTWPATWDQDNEHLTYKLYRDNDAAPVSVQTVGSRFWRKPTMYFIDSGLTACSTHTYRVVASDQHGNSTTGTALPSSTNCGEPETAVNTLKTGGQLGPGQALFSHNGQYRLVMQPDGNLVLYKGTSVLWRSATNNGILSYFTVQTDRNMVIYQYAYGPYWASNTSTSASGTYRLLVQNDGNVVAYDQNNSPFWSTNTSQP
ncbi:MAG: hypothetical protein WBP26_05960 [Candidatus Saccharimonadales bacterium]